MEGVVEEDHLGQEEEAPLVDEKLYANFEALPAGRRLHAVAVPVFVSSNEDAMQRMTNLDEVLWRATLSFFLPFFWFEAHCCGVEALAGATETLLFRLRRDQLTRPLFALKKNTSELVLRVTQRVSRSTGEVKSSSFVPIGIVDSTWTFDDLADYQMTDPRPLNKRARIGMKGMHGFALLGGFLGFLAFLLADERR